MRISACLLFTLALSAQDSIPLGYVRGVLMDCDTTQMGDFSVRAASTSQVLRFTFDRRTYVERDKLHITMALLQKGDAVEVVSDRVAGASARYARTVHVVGDEPVLRPLQSASTLRRVRPIDRIAPRGDLTYAGVISRLSDDELVLRTRRDGEKIFARRIDTYYLERGMLVEGSALQLNTRVFVRAGRNLDQELEVYQVIWGEILEPNRIP